MMTREPGDLPDAVVFRAGEVYRADERGNLSRNDSPIGQAVLPLGLLLCVVRKEVFLKHGLKSGLMASVALLSALSFSSVAVAQTTDADESEREEPVKTAAWTLPIIVTATGADSYSDETGQAITLITLEQIEKRQPSTLSDLLSTTTGVTVSRNGPIGGVTAVRIRGAEGEQTLTLVDGVRINDPSSPGGAFDFGNLLVGNIDSVEILRGPNSVAWGSQALGGIVNVQTARYDEDRLGTLRAEYGANDRHNFVGNVGTTLGPVEASLGGGYFRDEGISAFRDGTEADGYRQYAANGRVKVNLSDAINVDLRGYYADSRNDIDGFPPPFFGFADTAEFSKAQQLTGYAGINAAFNDGKFKNRLAVTLSDINRDNFSAPGQAAPDFLARGRTERLEYQGDWQLSDGLRTIFGAEHEKSRISDGFSSNATNVTSGYAQIVAKPVEALTLTGGVRLDDHKDYGSQTTFSGNLAWGIANGLLVRAAYGEGFKSPTLFQLESLFGNSLLQPETARSYEIGISFSRRPSIQASATLYRRDTRNQIDFISCFGRATGICTDRPFGTYNNIKQTSAQGIEIDLAIMPIEALTIAANYTLTDTEDKASGLALLRRPKHSVNLAVDWAAASWLNLGASLQMLSDSADVDFLTFGRAGLDGYALAGLRAAVPVNEQIEFYGRIENLFDARYETVSGYGTYGRNAHVGVRARF
jgi:vitamin B12 transporter